MHPHLHADSRDSFGFSEFSDFFDTLDVLNEPPAERDAHAQLTSYLDGTPANQPTGSYERCM